MPIQTLTTFPKVPDKFVIQLTRLNNTHLAVNSDLVKFVEAAPDTVITLITGEKVVVRESIAEVIQRIIQFRCSVLAGLPSVGANVGLANTLGKPTEEKPEEESGGGRG